MNAFFDDYINSKTILKQFVQQYDVTLQAKCEKEVQAEFDCAHKRPNLLTQFVFEKQLIETYTLTMLRSVKRRLSTPCTARFHQQDRMTVRLFIP